MIDLSWVIHRNIILLTSSLHPVLDRETCYHPCHLEMGSYTEYVWCWKQSLHGRQIKTASTIHSHKTNAYTNTQCNEDYCLCISLLHTLVSEQLYIHLTSSLGLHTCSPSLFFLSCAGLENNSSPLDKTLTFQTSLHKLILRSYSNLHYCGSFKNLLWTEVYWHTILKHFYKPQKYCFAGQEATVKVSVLI